MKNYPTVQKILSSYKTLTLKAKDKDDQSDIYIWTDGAADYISRHPNPDLMELGEDYQGRWGFLPDTDIRFFEPKFQVVSEQEPRRAFDKKAQKKKEPKFEFGNPNAINDFQRSMPASELDASGGDFKYRTGHSYAFLPARIKLYREMFGNPDIVHIVSGPSSAVHAVFFEKGKDMIKIWDRGNILSQFQWGTFEDQAKAAGYNIKSFSQGKIV